MTQVRPWKGPTVVLAEKHLNPVKASFLLLCVSNDALFEPVTRFETD
jgi:hypothetical protein